VKTFAHTEASSLGIAGERHKGKMKTKSASWLPIFIAAATTWGLSFLFIAVSLESFTPIGVAVGRTGLGALALVIWSLSTKQKFVTDRKVWGNLFITAFVMNSAPSVLFSFAEQYVSSSLAGILNATTPLFGIIFIGLVFRSERVTKGQIFGLCLGFIGVLLLFGDLSLQGKNPVLGIALILCATLGYGFSFPFAKTRFANTGYTSTSLATSQLIAGFIMLLPLALTQPLIASTPELKNIAAIVVLGFIGTGFAYVWNYRVIELLSLIHI
jgi:drug/metabolite transporter (DMT)-like permease